MRGSIACAGLLSACIVSLLSIPGGAQEFPSGVKVVPFYDANKVSFKDLKTIWMSEVPSLIKHFWVLDQDGQIWTLYPNAAGEYDATSKRKIADWSEECKEVLRSEYGAWGMAFHKQFQKNGKFYTIYLAHPPGNVNHDKKSGGEVVVDEWVASGPKFDQLQRGREIIRIKHEKAYGTCNIAMGPDGYLYLAINDYETDSRDLGILGRKILRLDIDKKEAGKEYAIPPDNPFVGEAGKRPEIWAYGFRNGWSMNFDALTGDLWLGDVGQKEVEELNIVVKGRNHGWKNGGDFASKPIDGFNGYCNKSPHGFVQEKDCSQFQDPEFAFPRSGNLAIACIAAGVTYRADPSSPFYGYHIFGDVNRNILVAHKKGGTPHVIGDVNHVGGDGHNGIVHYSSDAYGNLYAIFLSWDNIPHEIWRLDHPDLKPSAKPLDFGCTNPAAANYNAKAKYDDGTCNGVSLAATSSSPIAFSLSGLQLDVAEPGPFTVRLIDPAGKTVFTWEGMGPSRELRLGKGFTGLHVIAVESPKASLVKKVFLQ